MDDEVLDVPEDAKEKVSKEFNRSISEPPKEVGHLSVNPARKLSEGEAEAAGDNLTGMFFQKLIQNEDNVGAINKSTSSLASGDSSKSFNSRFGHMNEMTGFVA